jgi:endo-1,4-beta-D-glucanase Y
MPVKLKTAPVALALGLVAAVTSVLPNAAAAATAAQCDWPAYRSFVERFVQADGRVIDYSTPTQQTTSEGQSYGMFFALVANDRATFDRLLGWTRTNLAGNQFDAQDVRLPSWQWGKKPDGSFGVLDPNSASDSDLWIAFDLLQAGRLWNDSHYTTLGEALAKQIASKEVVSLARCCCPVHRASRPAT